MKNICLLILLVLSMSLTKDKTTTFHYPEFMSISWDEDKWGRDGSQETEGYMNGSFVVNRNDYLQGIDSVAIKYKHYRLSDDKMSESIYKVEYTGFYARAGDGKWKRYSANKNFVDTITEYRNDTVVDNYKYPNGRRIVYYRVR